ncbi:hypothetical protein Bhyg_02960 [Pseudolycoriella hygida]|uniref:Uncharacterized protein n=1 Tax=Pseudolycoriella hygida TaxID=35572 RepID=A0A9Q0S714_9DIPT|nr:hypothetical protein Bhyg_02960 [Pseudolycoriella hygida]
MDGFDVVKQKCEEKFNTSSADEQQEASNFRRKHPVLAKEAETFENVFDKQNVVAKQKTETKAKELRSLEPVADRSHSVSTRFRRLNQGIRPPISNQSSRARSRSRWSIHALKIHAIQVQLLEAQINEHLLDDSESRS